MCAETTGWLLGQGGLQCSCHLSVSKASHLQVVTQQRPHEEGDAHSVRPAFGMASCHRTQLKHALKSQNLRLLAPWQMPAMPEITCGLYACLMACRHRRHLPACPLWLGCWTKFSERVRRASSSQDTSSTHLGSQSRVPRCGTPLSECWQLA